MSLYVESEIKTQLKQWIASQSKSAEAKTVADDTAIIERRILSSLQIMDLILYIESLRKEPMDSDALKPGVFSSVNKIYETFFTNRSH